MESTSQSHPTAREDTHVGESLISSPNKDSKGRKCMYLLREDTLHAP